MTSTLPVEPARVSTWDHALLLVAVAVHIAMFVSLRFHFLNPLYDDAMHRSGQAADFFAVYQAGKSFQEGTNIYSRELKTRVVPYFYSYRYHPFVAATIGQAALLVRPDAAYILWIILQEGFLLVNIVVTRKLFRDSRQANVATAMWLLFSPYYLELHMGQFSFFMACLIYWSILAWMRNQSNRGNAFWILSILIKSNSVLLAPVLLKLRRWVPVALGGAITAGTAIPYFLLIPGSYTGFSYNYVESLSLQTIPGNLGFTALVGSLVLRSSSQWQQTMEGFMEHLPALNALLVRPVAIWTGLIVAGTLLVTWKAPRRLVVELFIFWILAYFLFYKHVWEHHYVMILPMFILLYYRRIEGIIRLSPWLFWPCVAAVALPTSFVFMDRPIALADPEFGWTTMESILFHAPKAVAVLVLYAALVRILWTAPADPPTTLAPTR